MSNPCKDKRCNPARGGKKEWFRVIIRRYARGYSCYRSKGAQSKERGR